MPTLKCTDVEVRPLTTVFEFTDGKSDAAAKYRRLAEEAVPKWMTAAAGGAAGGYRLAFDQPGTWSQKYNLVWDRMLGLAFRGKKAVLRKG